jgi:hypothetical protein
MNAHAPIGRLYQPRSAEPSALVRPAGAPLCLSQGPVANGVRSEVGTHRLEALWALVRTGGQSSAHEPGVRQRAISKRAMSARPPTPPRTSPHPRGADPTPPASRAPPDPRPTPPPPRPSPATRPPPCPARAQEPRAFEQSRRSTTAQMQMISARCPVHLKSRGQLIRAPSLACQPTALLSDAVCRRSPAVVESSARVHGGARNEAQGPQRASRAQMRVAVGLVRRARATAGDVCAAHRIVKAGNW